MKNGNYIEYEEKYGYSSINSFTKSILIYPIAKRLLFR